MGKDPIQKIHRIAQAIYDKKGINILAIDVRGVSSLTDYVLIAEGNVDRHVIGIAEEVIGRLAKEGEKPLYIEGLEAGDWVVIDCLDYMVHLFMPGLRDKYRLEELFSDGKIIDLKFKLTN